MRGDFSRPSAVATVQEAIPEPGQTGKKPLLLILANNEGNPHAPGVSDRWQAPFSAQGFEIQIVPYDIARLPLERLLQKANGIFLTGRDSNVDPFIYGQKPIDPAKIFDHGDRPDMEMNPERDLTAIIMAQEARRRGIPLLGACGGMQEMNVAFGGTLQQHIAGHDIGYADPSRRAEDVHKITLTAGGQLSRIMGKSATVSNSTHRQGMLSADIAEEFQIEAVADDGVVEAISLIGHRFFVGVQHHPEFSKDAPDNAALFSAFSAEVRRHASDKKSFTLIPGGLEKREI